MTVIADGGYAMDDSYVQPAHDQMRGHWGGFGCACPAPDRAPANNLTGDELDRYEVLTSRFVLGEQTHDELVEYAALWNRAFPELRPWRVAALVPA